VPHALTAVADSRAALADLTEIFRLVLDQPDLTLTEETSAADVPGWDSVTHIGLLVEVECRFGFTFQTAELDQLQRVGDLLRLIEAKRRA